MTYQGYMRGMSNGGSIAWDGATPLSNSELAAVCPSIFAEHAHESRSDRFVPIPTVHVLNGLRAADFMPVFAQQARTRIPGKGDYTRHMLRLRHRSMKNTAGEAFEVILVNANDGTSAYKMIAGIFRFVCTNGLFAGDAFDSVTVRHSGKSVVDDVRDGAVSILDMAPRVLDDVERFKAITLTPNESLLFGEEAHRLRFESRYVRPVDADGNEIADALPEMDADAVPILPLDVIRPKRTADSAPTLWNVFNVAQERLIRGGQAGRIIGKNGKVRNAKVREVKGIDQQTTLNRALWSLADKMAELKS